MNGRGENTIPVIGKMLLHSPVDASFQAPILVALSAFERVGTYRSISRVAEQMRKFGINGRKQIDVHTPSPCTTLYITENSANSTSSHEEYSVKHKIARD